MEEAMKQFDVVIADDSERARKAIRLILDTAPDFNIVGEAFDGVEVVEVVKECMPDAVLMDIHMPRRSGLEATRMIKQDLPYVTVVILSISDDAADLFGAIRSGAQGYLVKSLDPTDWISYLRSVLNGDAPLSRSMAQRLLAEFSDRPVANVAIVDTYDKLTPRESDILRLVATGATNKDIAQELFIAENTVKNHLKNIMSKLHIRNRVQLAALARSAPQDPRR